MLKMDIFFLIVGIANVLFTTLGNYIYKEWSRFS